MFNLSDPGVEELLYESAPVRRLVAVYLGIAPAPDETTILRFRYLLEKHELGGLMLEAVNIHLEAQSIRIGTATIVAATIIAAPSSTKNASGERDPEMHSAKQGNQWHFGQKARIGVDATEGCALGADLDRACVGGAYASGLVTWRGAQDVGRRRLLGLFRRLHRRLRR